jgi:hypothetical protein
LQSFSKKLLVYFGGLKTHIESRTKMAYSVVFSVPEHSRQKYVCFPGVNSPFEHWLSSCKEGEGEGKDVLFSYDIHQGLDITEHLMFVPDKGGDAGDLLFVGDADYSFVDICARVLIDKHQKQIYIASAVVDFENTFWGEENKYIGGLRVFKRKYESVAEDMVQKFFGVDWRFHIGFKKRHQRNIAKRHRKQLKALDPECALPLDIQRSILQKMNASWPGEVSVIKKEQIARLKDIAKNNVGAAGYYAWNSVIAVYQPNNN